MPPYPEEAMEPSAVLVGEQYRYTKAGTDMTQRSIAISLKRIADMMEEDRKPQLTLMPEGYESEHDRRHRVWCEKIDRAHEIELRNAVTLEAIAGLFAATPNVSGLSHTGVDRG